MKKITLYSIISLWLILLGFSLVICTIPNFLFSCGSSGCSAYIIFRAWVLVSLTISSVYFYILFILFALYNLINVIRTKNFLKILKDKWTILLLGILLIAILFYVLSPSYIASCDFCPSCNCQSLKDHFTNTAFFMFFSTIWIAIWGLSLLLFYLIKNKSVRKYIKKSIKSFK